MNLWRQTLLALAAIAFVVCGCSSSHYRKSADKETYGIIQSRSPLVTNMESGFTIEQTNRVSLASFPVTTNSPDFLGAEAAREKGAAVLRLEDALMLGIEYSRRYQSEKETLYLSALDLTLTRHAFAPLFSASTTIRHEVDEVVKPNDPMSDRVINSTASSVDASWLIRDVGRITADFTSDALRFITGDRSLATSSRLSARFTRPLLRNAAYKSQIEALTQGERDLLYALRSFTQFRKDFSVDLAKSYYDVLSARDTARNSFLNLQSSRKNAERSRALAQEGRITQSDLGRLEQQELSAESSWINAVRAYEQNLDNFKLTLGLSVSNNIVLDDRELQSLRILSPDISLRDSLEVALANRVDFLNARDEFEDTERKVKLAENFLLPQVDFSAGVGVGSNPNSKAFFAAPDPARYSWDAGFAVDPGLDRKAERNSYRRAIITRNKAARNVELVEDTIRMDVRESWRTLDQARRNYEIAEIGVRVSERRVEEQDILAELGRAKAQDQVDAQNALIDSKNQRTVALVTHTIARLRFWNQLGILFIKDNGQWKETKDVESKSSR